MLVRCPAKVNLFLSVGPADSTGYHPLCTVFQAVSLFDTMTIEVSDADTDTISCSWAEFPSSNTVAKALSLAREFVEIPPLSIHIEKSIPAQAGLGGGSSNAAGLLRAINRFAPVPLSDQAKHEIALAVGSDVPFFLLGGCALGEGRGERLTPLPDPVEAHYTIVMPDGVHVSTKEAYARLDGHPLKLRSSPQLSPFDCSGMHNDFELVMPQECREAMNAMLRAGAECVHLCGSGAAVFGVGDGIDGEALKQYSRKWRVRALTGPESTRV